MSKEIEDPDDYSERIAIYYGNEVECMKKGGWSIKFDQKSNMLCKRCFTKLDEKDFFYQPLLNNIYCRKCASRPSTTCFDKEDQLLNIKKIKI